MNLSLDKISTVDQMRAFVEGAALAEIVPLDRDGTYALIANALERVLYPRLGKADKGAVKRFLETATGLSRAQVTRLGPRRHLSAGPDRRAGLPDPLRLRARRSSPSPGRAGPVPPTGASGWSPLRPSPAQPDGQEHNQSVSRNAYHPETPVPVAPLHHTPDYPSTPNHQPQPKTASPPPLQAHLRIGKDCKGPSMRAVAPRRCG